MNFYLVKIRGTQSVDVFSFEEELKTGIDVIVSSERGREIGRIKNHMVDAQSFGKIEGIAQQKDVETYWENAKEAQHAKRLCQEKIKELKLDMEPISVAYNMDRSKVFIDYMSKERVDFRDLLKELSRDLKTRIELKQLGVRDCARVLGGIGTCGRTVCCQFKQDFKSVTISMAKNQMIPINNDTLAGICGKLKCCLAYENDLYTECRKRFPKLNSRVTFNKEEYTVADVNCCSEKMLLINRGERIYITLEEFNQRVGTDD